MKSIKAIMIMTAFLSVLGIFGTQQAMAGTGGVTGTVTISKACELVTPSTLAYPTGNPLTDSSTGSSPGVGETILLLSNTNGNTGSDVSVLGDNWKNSVSPFGNVQSVGTTKFFATTTSFAGKTALTTSLQPLKIVPPGSSTNSFFDVAIDLDLDPAFFGTASQSMTLDFTCL
jgi:hypothetical protein